MHCKKRKKTDTERVKIFIGDCVTVSKTLTANNTNEIVLINRPKGLSLENKLTKFYHNPSLKNFKCRATARSYPTTKRDCSGVQKQELSPDEWQ